ncbi:MAG: RseA family anti-sigma factor [Orrella sp.]
MEDIVTNKSVATSEESSVSTQRLSALFDGELNDSDLSPDLFEHKEDWELYALIGESLSQSSQAVPIQLPSSSFGIRMAAALEREPAHGATQQSTTAVPKGGRVRTKWFAWPGLAMAAAVAAVVWVAQPLFLDDEPLPVAAVSSPASVPAVSDYTSAHRHLSGPLAVRQASFEPEGGQ